MKDCLDLKENAILKIIRDERAKWEDQESKAQKNQQEWCQRAKSEIQSFKENLKGHLETSLLEEHRESLGTKEARERYFRERAETMV